MCELADFLAFFKVLPQPGTLNNDAYWVSRMLASPKLEETHLKRANLQIFRFLKVLIQPGTLNNDAYWVSRMLASPKFEATHLKWANLQIFSFFIVLLQTRNVE